MIAHTFIQLVSLQMMLPYQLPGHNNAFDRQLKKEKSKLQQRSHLPVVTSVLSVAQAAAQVALLAEQEYLKRDELMSRYHIW